MFEPLSPRANVLSVAWGLLMVALGFHGQVEDRCHVVNIPKGYGAHIHI